jgi:hypothetical protein
VFEQSLLKETRLIAAEEEDAFEHNVGERRNPEIRHIDLVRDYPSTALRIVVHDRVRNIEMPQEFPIWDSYFENREGEMREPSWIAGEILRWARGG